MIKEFEPYLERIEQELKFALPLLPNQKWRDTVFSELPSSVQNSHFSPLLTPTRNLVQLGGKRWRPLLQILCTEATLNLKKIDDESKRIKVLDASYRMVPLVEFVHTASLIHDDIEDSSDTRRGKPAAYITYGVDTALNAGSWLYFQAATCIDSSPFSEEIKNRFYSTYTKELRRLHLGQAMDISWHRNPASKPSVDEYFAMVRCKTGTLASLAVRIGILAAGGRMSDCDKAGRIAADIGAGFQILDDVTNLSTGNPGKKRGDDIVEEKKSLPVLLYITKAGSNETAYNALKGCFERAHYEGIGSSAVEEAIKLLEVSGVINAARDKGISLINQGCAEFEKLFSADNEAVKRIKTLFTSMIPEKKESEA